MSNQVDIKDKENAKRDNCGKVNFVNIPYFNTGSVVDVQCKESGNKELDLSLDRLKKSLSEDRKKFKMDDFFASSSF